MVDLSITDSLAVGTLVFVTCSVVGIIILSDLYYLISNKLFKIKKCVWFQLCCYLYFFVSNNLLLLWSIVYFSSSR